MSELKELRASLSRAQRELDSAHDRLDALESASGSPTATVFTPRGMDRKRREMILIGALSSLGTAVLIGLCALAFSSKPAPPPAQVAVTPPPPLPVVIPPPPPVESVAIPEPLPVVTPPEPPRPPSRVARVNPYNPDTPARAREPSSDLEGMGSLSVVCLPVKCDSITDNGVPLGPGHIFSRPVTPGRHHLVLHGPNGATKAMTVEIKADQLKEIRVAMSNASDVF